MSIQLTIKKNRQNFLKFNQAKYQRFQQLIASNNNKNVVNALPLLLCLNEKKIPGYVEGEVPIGIQNYNPDEDAIKYVQARFHVSELNTAFNEPFIEMMAIMGSVGTVAYNKKSDFDYWVCVNKKLVSPEAFANFGKKVEEIQKWAIQEMDTEVHMFINDIPGVKNNIFAEDEDEAFGSTTGAVLKDEFYRSSIIIAGKVPLWWVVPIETTDEMYEKIIKHIPKEWMQKYFIDIGNLYRISKEDFMGAALFQLIKSLGNPFKSIIKIGVLEKYLFSPDDEPLLSQKVKAAIQSGNFENKILDSYILMFEEVYKYYESALEDKSLLTILKQNLYLKIDPQLSKYGGVKDKRNVPYKVIVMYKYIKAWGSSKQGIKELDNFENWDYNTIMNFWNQVKKFMLLSYQKISQQLPTLNLAQKISDSDFKLLSRKIKTHFSSSEDKIDQYVTFKETPHESVLYIEPMNVGIKEVEWRMYKRTLNEMNSFDTTLKTEKYLIKLLAWISINQIFNPAFSRVKIQSGYTRVDQNLVTELLTKIYSMFTGTNIVIKNDYYLKPSFNLINMIILNFNSKNAESIQTIHYLFKTSWGESYIHEYHSVKDHVKILENILSSGIRLNKKFSEFCEIISPEPFKKLYKDIEQLYQEAYEFFTGGLSTDYRRFVTVIGDLYYSIVKEKNTIKVSSYDSLYKLLATINLLPKMHIQTKFFGYDKKLMTLNEIMKFKKNFMITLVYEEAPEGLFLYIINESGNIFTFVKTNTKKDEVIINLFNFCLKAIKQVTEFTTWPDNVEAFNVYRLDTDRFGKISFTDESKIYRAHYLSKYKGDKSLSVTILRQPGKEAIFTLSFPDGSQSEPTQFKKLIEVLLKKNPAKIPLLLNSILFDCRGVEPIHETSPYFSNKYRLEIIMDKIFK